MTAHLLDVEGLHAGYGSIEVVHGIDFKVEHAGVSVLLGANGAGKTTTLRAISGLIGRNGSIKLDGKGIDRVDAAAIARLGLAHVPADRGTFSDLTVEENLRLGAYRRSDRDLIGSDRDKVLTYFPKLRQRLAQTAGTLSGGEQQMLAIGRALMTRPKLLMLDEPSFGLAPLIVEEIFKIMHEVQAVERMGILLVEQNVRLALGLVGQAYLIESGRVVFSGSTDVMRQNDAVRRAYLGY